MLMINFQCDDDYYYYEGGGDGSDGGGSLSDAYGGNIPWGKEDNEYEKSC